MLKFLAALVIACLPFAPAFSDPIDELFDAAMANDADAVDALLASAETPTLRRDMVWLLGASHPDLRAFTKAWAEAEPNNPAALTARAWSRYREGFLIRGPDLVKFTWPESLMEGQRVLAEAFDLAEQALTLDPGYLPASDAVIIIGEVSGHQGRKSEEAARVLELSPNRHSLVIAARAVWPDWLGRRDVKTHLCDSYAEKVTDAPGYTAEMCVIEATYKGSTCCDGLRWANDRIVAYLDELLMEASVLWAADKQNLPLEAADRLRAKLMSEDRLTVRVAISGRPDILTRPYQVGNDPLVEFEAIKEAFARDLAEAQVAADRDPGNPDTLGDLAFYHQVATSLGLRDAGYYGVHPPDDILERYNAVMEEWKVRDAEMKERALTLIRLSPRNRDALLFGASFLDNHLEDPLQSAIWRRDVLNNAVLYANYSYIVVGDYLLRTKFDRSTLEQKSEHNRAPTYSDKELTEAFDCPYVRALRLFEAACESQGEDLETCYRNAGLSREREFSDSESAYVRVQAAGTCKAELEAPLDSLLYEEIDLGLN